MSHFLASQTRRLCVEVDRYARKLGFIAAGESVKFRVYDTSPAPRRVTFLAGERRVTVAITEESAPLPTSELAIFPCGQQLPKWVKTAAQNVVHALFDPV